ncbi:MAG: 6-aminohexanoate hydrolase, partial [Mesorhizobium sp.]
MDSYRNSDPRPPIMQGSPPRLVPPKLDWDRPRRGGVAHLPAGVDVWG